MNKFINRIEELEFLDKKWLAKEPCLIVVYGKRRVGKTELIKQFSQNKNAVYFLADKRTTKDQLKELGQIIGHHFNDELLIKNGFAEWLDVFRYLRRNVKKPLIFAVDEYPYLLEADASAGSIFQKGWDEYLKNVPVFLILSGSSMAMMEAEVLSYKAPLYGRRSGQILVEPMSFSQSRQFFRGLSFEETLAFYTLAGGMPAYLLEMDASQSLEVNFKQKVLDRREFLYNEVEFILREELREPRVYLSILAAISLGKTRASEILNATGLEKSHLHKYLGVLEHLQLVQRELSVTETNPAKSKKGLYKLSDNFFKIWFQFVYPLKSSLEIGDQSEALKKFKATFPLLTCLTYEQVCQEILRQRQPEIFPFEKVGRWWDRNLEIDMVAFNAEQNKILFGECKWSNKKVGTDILAELAAKAKSVEWGLSVRTEHFALFSKSGFTPNLVKMAKEMGNVYLFTQDNLYAARR